LALFDLDPQTTVEQRCCKVRATTATNEILEVVPVYVTQPPMRSRIRNLEGSHAGPQLAGDPRHGRMPGSSFFGEYSAPIFTELLAELTPAPYSLFLPNQIRAGSSARIKDKGTDFVTDDDELSSVAERIMGPASRTCEVLFHNSGTSWVHCLMMIVGEAGHFIRELSKRW
jgi:hypothetical protein